MSVVTRVSLEEFLANPDIHYYDFHELHNGEVVIVSPPSQAHTAQQVRLEELLRSLLRNNGYQVLREFYYTMESNSRRADVAAVSDPRRQATPSNKSFRGGPDLVVEILSPSNTALDLDQLRAECFREGTRQFWVINAELRTVTVYRSRSIEMYDVTRPNIPLDEFVPAAVLPVNSIFG